MSAARTVSSFLARGRVGIRVSTICAVLLLVLADRLVYVDPPAVLVKTYRLDFFMSSTVPGLAQVYFDIGHGFNAADSAAQPVAASSTLLPYMFPIEAGKVRRLRIDFLMQPGTVSITNARVVSAAGNEIRKLRPEEFVPNNQISFSRQDPDGVTAVAPDGVNDPYYVITFEPPIHLASVDGPPFARNPWLRAGFIVAAFAVFGLLQAALARWRPRWHSTLATNWNTWYKQRPRACLCGVAVLATIASCYPVIFFGRSFVSPNVGSLLLYNGAPTIPGISSNDYESVQGADVGAMMWAHLPYSHVEHRAIFQDGEIPLWNRFNSGGVPLLGQGQSMLGDPLHAFVIAAGGSAWAWDVKFLVARVLFCTAVGWLAFAATRHLAASALITLSAAFIGLFYYRINHPAILTVCYSPWILLAWVEFAGSRRPRATLGWLCGILVANVTVFASGTVKEASMAIAVLNCVGLLTLLAAPRRWTEKFRFLFVVAAGVLAGLLIGAPLWLTFLGTLHDAQTFSDGIIIVTRQWQLIIGLFDGILLQESFDQRPVVGPSGNFLILLGLLLYLLRFRQTWHDRIAGPSVLGALISCLLAFGLVPVSWVAAVPGLRQVAHVQDTFSCVAIVLLFLPAARGLADAWNRSAKWGALGEIALVLLLVGALLALFATVDPSRWWGHGTLAEFWRIASRREYFLRALGLMLAGMAILLAVIARRRRNGKWTPALVILGCAALIPLLARHGQRMQRGYDEYFFRPMARPDFSVPSPAVDWIKKHSPEPFRVAGTGQSLIPGYTGVLGLEGINGPDAIMSRPYRELALAAGLVDPHDWIFFSDPDSLAKNRPFLDFLNVGYFVANHATPPPGDSLEKLAALDLKIYRSPTAWPRAFFTDAVAPTTTAEEMVDLLRAGDGRPFAAMNDEERIAAGIAPGSLPARNVRPATNYRLTNNTTSFALDATGPGIAVLTETGWPDAFTAWLDGERVPVLRVNHAFKGVAIRTAGPHQLTFRYEPRYFRLSLGLGTIGLAGLVVLAWFLWRSPVGAPLPTTRGTS